MFITGALVAMAAIAGAAIAYALLRKRSGEVRIAAPVDVPVGVPVRVTSGEVQLVRPNPDSVEGLEIRYGSDALVRAVQVGAMNSEHKELLLTMDDVQWGRLPNAQKQEVVAAARSTWASKMCGSGPDIAYVVVKTEHGQIVGRADPHHVTVW